MKRGSRLWMGVGVLVAFLLISGCGSKDSVDAELASDGGGTGITNLFESASDMGVGDIMAIEFEDGNEVSIDFSGVDSTAQFILAVGSHSEASGTQMQLSAADMSLPEPSAMTAGMIDGDFAEVEQAAIEGEEYGAAEILHAWLRASESVLHLEEVSSQSASASMAKSIGFKAAALGATETFRVLSSLSSTSSYAEVEARVRCVGDEVVFYVDTDVEGTDSDLATADMNDLCEDFDRIAGEEQVLLGASSDKDADGKVHVLMTPQINRLGALGGGIITGYFYAGDLYDRSGSNQVSNEREIIYTLVPDPDGDHGTAISQDFAMDNLLPAVLPHELQHAISYNQHVFVSGGSPEENWLNEGMSHLMEDVMGHGVENPSRYAMFLSSPSSYGLVTQSSPNLMERGASYLFLRYLYEQADDGAAFLRALEATELNGVSNLETAFAGSESFDEFSEFVSRWIVTLAMSDRGLTRDERYVYQDRTRDASTGNWKGVIIDGEADDGRGTELTGVNLNNYYGYHTANIDSGTAKFFEMTTMPNELTIEGTSGSGNFGMLIRTQ